MQVLSKTPLRIEVLSDDQRRLDVGGDKSARFYNDMEHGDLLHASNTFIRSCVETRGTYQSTDINRDTLSLLTPTPVPANIRTLSLNYRFMNSEVGTDDGRSGTSSRSLDRLGRGGLCHLCPTLGGSHCNSLLVRVLVTLLVDIVLKKSASSSLQYSVSALVGGGGESSNLWEFNAQWPRSWAEEVGLRGCDCDEDAWAQSPRVAKLERAKWAILDV
ncbi:hypothetical protein C8J56DRAFT_879716 [Mycena floridula]|nr:hypothetical protein C8J56DRAFT_879716 [Mycena floridula]